MSFGGQGCFIFALWAGVLLSSCGINQGEEGYSCETGETGETSIRGTPWVPDSAAIGMLSNRDNGDGETIVDRTTLTASGPVSGIESEPSLIPVEIPMPSDLGEGGSLSLIAESDVSGESGGAFPLLVSLNDGEKELVNLQPSGASACPSQGYFCCNEQSCSPNPLWKIEYPSAFTNRDHWEERQVSVFGFMSVNSFPTCSWTSSDLGLRCVFTDPESFSRPSKLRFGKNYVARYALVSGAFSASPGVQGRVRLTVLRKAQAARTRANIDFNVVIVGSKNIAASRTSEGKRNLNALFKRVNEIYSQPGSGISIGRVNVFEWACEQGGDAFSDVSVEELEELFRKGSALMPSETETRAVNLFMVSNLRGGPAGFTLLGVSGGIVGPMINGTAASGLAFSTFNRLERYNSSCGGDCPDSLQDRDFYELSVTISHEVGHFLGLNHLSESDGEDHDRIPDTPVCTETESSRTGRLITVRSCRQQDSNVFPMTGRTCLDACPRYDGRTDFCPDAIECEFNHLMWWTTKNFRSGSSDGCLLSPDSSALIRFSPFVR